MQEAKDLLRSHAQLLTLVTLVHGIKHVALCNDRDRAVLITISLTILFPYSANAIYLFDLNILFYPLVQS